MEEDDNDDEDIPARLEENLKATIHKIKKREEQIVKQQAELEMLREVLEQQLGESSKIMVSLNLYYI